jgi:uncharacterized short protein YbdD (DUF466 family)
MTPVQVAKAAWGRSGFLTRAWTWLRQVSGDAAYENYLRSTRRSASQQPPLSRAQFYLDALERRYSATSRCC